MAVGTFPIESDDGVDRLVVHVDARQMRVQRLHRGNLAIADRGCQFGRRGKNDVHDCAPAYDGGARRAPLLRCSPALLLAGPCRGTPT